MTVKNICYIGIGANLNDPAKQVRTAINSIGQINETTLIDSSSLYQSVPMGPQDQPDYVNAVAKVETLLAAEDLLDSLQSIENQQGRIRKSERWGPRIIDLDIITFGNKTINSKRLTVPHYGIRERNFVLLPLKEIAPDFSLPSGESIDALLSQVDLQGIMKLE